MKKRIVLPIVLFLIILSPLLLAANETNSTSTSTESSEIEKAYQCLEDKVVGKCSSLSAEEKVFSLLAIGECGDQVVSESDYKDDTKYTAQAVLALNKEGRNVVDAEEWLLAQKDTTEDLTWYLQIESSSSTSCEITYEGDSHEIEIDEDKRIDSGAGSCLSRSEGDYWLRISDSCFEEEFEISCDQPFLTNLLYKKDDSSTIYVSEKTSSQSAEGTTKEKVNSFCFTDGSDCDYEASLWAALALDTEGYDISSFLPYLITSADENSEFLPESFLYYLTGYNDFRTDLLLNQKGEYWDESGNKFYDTSVALYPLQKETSSEKNDAKEWLLNVQDSDGCWQGNIRDTAFILASVWPRGISNSGSLDCEDAGYYCMSGAQCEGNVLSDYSCSYPLKCCNTKTVQTCAELGGSVCNSAERCVGGTESFSASDLGSGESCCLRGQCAIPAQSDEDSCEDNGGTCRINSCSNGEVQSSFSCSISGDICCKKSAATTTKSYLWLWILIILIIFVLVGIFFREKLRALYWKFKTRGSSKPSSGRPSPPGSSMPQRAAPPRRMIPPRSSPQFGRPIQKKPSEMDEVLKKLKEMSK